MRLFKNKISFKNKEEFTTSALADEDIYQAFIKRWVSEENKPIGFEDLEYAFTSNSGKKYYSYQSLTIPPTRETKKNEYIMWLSSGVTSQQLDDLIDLGEQAIEDGVLKLQDKKRFNIIRLSAIFQELRTRKNVNNTEVIYNILAVTLVREDENPSKFDEEVQEQKVKEFMEDAEGENRFFFAMPELSRYCGSLNISKENWDAFLEGYKVAEERHQDVITTLSSRSK